MVDGVRVWMVFIIIFRACFMDEVTRVSCSVKATNNTRRLILQDDKYYFEKDAGAILSNCAAGDRGSFVCCFLAPDSSYTTKLSLFGVSAKITGTNRCRLSFHSN